MTLFRKMLVGFGLIVVALAAIVALYLWPTFSPPDNIEVGTPIGERVPMDQPLRDASGSATKLADISGENGTVLVLVRSADWCPFCKAQLRNHAKIAEELEARGFALASLSYDEPAKLTEFMQDLERPFVMLSDTSSAFIDAVGLRDPEYDEDHFAFGVPRASILVLSPGGTIQAKLVSADYRQRPDNEFVLEMVNGVAN